MNHFTAAVIQMTSTPDLDHNLAEAEGFVRAAAREGARWIGLPENFSFFGPEAQRRQQAAVIAARSEAFLLQTARTLGVWILGGGHPVPAPDGRTYNRSVLVGPGGAVATYDKIHLFDVDLPDQPYRESEHTAPGSSTVIADAGDCGRIGLSICYDLRFPELYRDLSAQGAEILAVPAAFTTYTGPDHWMPLLRARAIENTCFVVAPAQCGTHSEDRSTHGHAAILDPWGTVLADAGDHPGWAVAEMDPNRLREVRTRIPSLRHRR